MKKIIILIGLFCVTGTFSQLKVDINTDMFVQLVFETAIHDFKTGAPDLVVVDYRENSLTVQSLSDEVKTNISVKTTDGLFYSFIVEYKPSIDKLFYNISRSNAINYKSQISNTAIKKITKENKTTLVTSVDKIHQKKGFIRNRNTKKYKKIYFSIRGVYVEEQKLYFLFNIKNKSNIDYEIDNITFIANPIVKSKRKITAEGQEYKPLYFHKNLDIIKSKKEKNIVAVFNKFTINNEKKIEVTLTEKSGERTVILTLNSNYISNAHKL